MNRADCEVKRATRGLISGSESVGQAGGAERRGGSRTGPTEFLPDNQPRCCLTYKARLHPA